MKENKIILDLRFKIEELKNNQRLINNLLKKLKLLIREFFCVKILEKFYLSLL